MLKTNYLSKCYGECLAVDSVNLIVKKGEITGFIGKNGAGKTTLINMFLKLIYPSNGSFEINGKVSFAPSEPHFYKGLTIKELINFEKSVSDVYFDKIKYLLSYFELDEEKKVETLSLGNRKKLSILLAIIKKHELLVLDEPTNGLDPVMQKKLFDYLLLEKENGKTIFLSSHNLSEVEKYCDKVAVIKLGKITEVIDLKKEKIKSETLFEATLKGGLKKEILTCDINKTIKELAKEDVVDLSVSKKNLDSVFSKEGDIYGKSN